jgi:glycosyltransferase involved in cell wall biosynthesis
MIDACLASLAGVDELVVVDHASTDDTATRAAQARSRPTSA